MLPAENSPGAAPCNLPLAGEFCSELGKKMKDLLIQKLPPCMVPDQFVALGSLDV